MKIESIEILEVKLDLKHFFETSFSRVTYQRFLLLRVQVDGVVGISECVADEGPSYSYETVKTALHVLEDFVAPLAFRTECGHPDEFLPSMRSIRGHNMAKAAVEMGLWEAYARMRGESLSKALGGTRREIASGVSIGIQDSVDQLLAKIEQELADGYRRIKMKIKPGWDVDVVRRVRERFADTPLMVDANSAYSLKDVPLFQKMDAFDLMMIEQPLHYEDMWDHAKLQKQIKTPICLDESIHSVEDARRAIEMGATRIINIKAGRVGGLSSARNIQKLAGEHGIPVWCGGMLESGVGRAYNVALASLPGFVLPGDVSPSARYWAKDVVAPEWTMDHGVVSVPLDRPGIGVDVDADHVQSVTARSLELRA